MLFRGLQRGLLRGLKRGLGVSVGPSVPNEGGIFFPSTAAHFASLGIATPSHLWPCQEASGNLADSLGGLSLVAAGTPLYQQSVPGFTRKAVGFNEGAGQRFTVAAGSGPNPATTSVAWLGYFRMTAGVGGVNRRVLCACDGIATTGVMANLTTSNVVRLLCVAVGANGSYDYNDGALHPMLLVYDRTNSLVRCYTDKEQVNGTYNSGAVDAAKGLGAPTNNSFPGAIPWAIAAGGATAEGYGKTTLQKLGWALAY